MNRINRLGGVCAAFLLASAAHATDLPSDEIQPETAVAGQLAANAADPARRPGAEVTTAAPAETVATTQSQPVADASPLAEADLSLLHGGMSVVTANQTLTSTTSNNVLTGDYVAGSVTLSDQSLTNFDGLGNFAINTGAQVSIQSAMTVTINVGE